VPREEVPRTLGHAAVATVTAPVTTGVQMFGGQVLGHRAAGGYAQTVAEHGRGRNGLESLTACGEQKRARRVFDGTTTVRRNYAPKTVGQ